MAGEAQPAAAGGDSLGSFGLAGITSDTQTEDAILEGSSPEVGDQVAEPEATPAGDAGQSAEPAAAGEPATGAPKPDTAAGADNVPSAMPKELSALLKDPQVAPKLQAVMPQIQSAFDQLSRIREVFPTVRAVHEFAEAFPGGLEEAKAAAQKSAMLDEADDQFSGGPEQQRALAEEWANDNPEAFQSMFVQSASLLRERDPQAYNQITSQVFHDRIAAAGFDEQIEAFRRVLSTGNKDTWAERLPGLVQWMVNKSDELGIKWTKSAGQVPAEITAAQREREAATSERQAAFNERVDLYKGQVGASVHTSLTQSVSAMVNPLLKESAFSDAGKSKIREQIIAEMDRTIRADRNVQRQITRITQEGFRKGGNVEEAKKNVVALLTGRAKQLLSATAKKVITERTAELLAANSSTNARRAAAGARNDVGTGGAPPAIRTRKLTVKDTEGMSDEDIMNA